MKTDLIQPKSREAEDELSTIEKTVFSDYKYGFVTQIEADEAPKGLNEDVIRFIAENVKSSVRELEGSIIKLLAYASLKHRDVSIELAREALRDKLRVTASTNDNNHPALTVTTIQQIVAKEWGVTQEGLKSKTRTKVLTVPRQIAMFLTRDLLQTQLIEIGKAFGGRDHSTVIHSIEKTAERIDADPAFKNRVYHIRSLLETLRS